MELEPGPFWNRDTLPLPPRVVYPGLFANVGGELEPLVSGDAVLATQQNTIADVNADGFDASLNATIGYAESVYDWQQGAGPGNRGLELADAGDGAQHYHDDVVRYLPPPDTPIETGFVPPPPTNTIIEEPRLPPEPGQ